MVPICNLYSAHSDSSRSCTAHLHRDDLTNGLSFSFFVLLENSKYQKVILETICICTALVYTYSSHCISIGFFSIFYYSTVITHRPTVRYGSGFIAFPWSRVFVGSSVVLSQAAYGDPSLGLTPLINSPRCCAESHMFDWLTLGAASLEVSSDWLRRALH